MKGNLRGLAWRLTVAYDALDPYSFDDAFDTFGDGLQCVFGMLKEDPGQLSDLVSGWRDDSDDAGVKKELSAILQDLAEMA